MKSYWRKFLYLYTALCKSDGNDTWGLDNVANMSKKSAVDLTRFLTDLARHELGRVIIANMAAGLAAGLIDVADCLDVLFACIATYRPPRGADGKQAYDTLVHAVETRPHLMFRRDLAHDIGDEVVIVLRRAFFFPVDQDLDRAEREGWLLFDRQYVVRSRKWQGDGAHPVQDSGRLTQDVVDGIATHLRKGAKLGGGHFAVFVARVNEDWPATTKRGADHTRDYLGLSHDAGAYLLELHCRIPLSEIKARGVKVARPTVFAAWRCSYFRQVPDQPGADHWGRTVDLIRLKALHPVTDGAQEAVLDSLPFELFREKVQVKFIGKLERSPAASVHEHTRRLYGRRTEDEVIAEIVDQCLRTGRRPARPVAPRRRGAAVDKRGV